MRHDTRSESPEDHAHALLKRLDRPIKLIPGNIEVLVVLRSPAARCVSPVLSSQCRSFSHCIGQIPLSFCPDLQKVLDQEVFHAFGSCSSIQKFYCPCNSLTVKVGCRVPSKGIAYVIADFVASWCRVLHRSEGVLVDVSVRQQDLVCTGH